MPSDVEFAVKALVWPRLGERKGSLSTPGKVAAVAVVGAASWHANINEEAGEALAVSPTTTSGVRKAESGCR